ncbi:MAG: molecular chaperone DnaJ [Gammaproteobacteria bacterium SG8_11]|nr:MAG: molecular chaperone DnaJ [Gammaproteobacteria bacterium SG8_11]
MEKDYYELLGVPRDADTKKIKDAYHRLAMKYHPDRNPSPDAAEKFKEISKAYAILSDPKKRANYDAGGFEGVKHYSQEDLFRDLDLGSIFGDMGLGAGSIFDRFFHEQPRGPVRGQDLYINVQVPLEVIAKGGKEKIRYSRPVACSTCHGHGTKSGKAPAVCPSCQGSGRKVITRDQSGGDQRHIRYQQLVTCPDCNGRGTVAEAPCEVCRGSGRQEKFEALNINIPAGIDDGTVLRVPNHGLPSDQPGGANGDLHVHVYSAPDKRFQRRGADLWRIEYISVEDAVLGSEIKVPTLDGRVKVKIPPGTQPDEVLRLRNKGLPKFRGSGYGDLHLRIQVQIPDNLTGKERELYEALRALHKAK